MWFDANMLLNSLFLNWIKRFKIAENMWSNSIESYSNGLKIFHIILFLNSKCKIEFWPIILAGFGSHFDSMPFRAKVVPLNPKILRNSICLASTVENLRWVLSILFSLNQCDSTFKVQGNNKSHKISIKNMSNV